MDKHVWAVVVGGVALLSSGNPQAAVVEGTFTAVVTEASDPGQLSFGRDPADWVGRTVNGTFSYDVDTPNVLEERPLTNVWNYFDPARNTRWVYVTASIDGVTFVTSSPEPDPTGKIGGIVGIWDGSFGDRDWYGVQDAYLSLAGRTVVGFDVFGPKTLFAYSGSGGAVQFDFDPFDPAVLGEGIVEDLAIVGGTAVRSGLIRFRLTSLSFGQSTEALVAELLAAVTGIGPGGSLADKMAMVQAYVEAGDTESACQMLHAFTNQVSAQSGKQLSEEEATQLLIDAGEISERLGCD